MTKLRGPVTIENTLYRVLGEISIERAAEVTARSEGYLRALSDPDKRERLTVEDAILLDLEHRSRGGTGFPLFETIGRMLDAASSERFADATAIALSAAALAKESGEAVSTLIQVGLPGATDAQLDSALRELEQADEAGHAAIATIRAIRGRPRDPPSSIPP